MNSEHPVVDSIQMSVEVWLGAGGGSAVLRALERAEMACIPITVSRVRVFGIVDPTSYRRRTTPL